MVPYTGNNAHLYRLRNYCEVSVVSLLNALAGSHQAAGTSGRPWTCRINDALVAACYHIITQSIRLENTPKNIEGTALSKAEEEFKPSSGVFW